MLALNCVGKVNKNAGVPLSARLVSGRGFNQSMITDNRPERGVVGPVYDMSSFVYFLYILLCEVRACTVLLVLANLNSIVCDYGYFYTTVTFIKTSIVRYIRPLSLNSNINNN